MADKNGICVWKWVCSLVVGISISIMGTGFAAWQAFGGGVTRSEVSLMIQTEAPYTKDKEAIQIQLDHIQGALKRIETKVNHLHDRPGE